jgi:hypothetical protein
MEFETVLTSVSRIAHSTETFWFKGGIQVAIIEFQADRICLNTLVRMIPSDGVKRRSFTRSLQ